MKIESKIKTYEMRMMPNSLDQKAAILSQFPSTTRFFYFIDQTFYKLYQDKLTAFIGDHPFFLIPADESEKEYSALQNYIQLLLDHQFTRKDVLVTFGGGILQDISGFIASILYRGIGWIYFPTTLLAQADSCIGSKTSINFGTAKNLVGTFYPPDLIINDSQFLKTITDDDFASGVGEIIKFHILSTPPQYQNLTRFLTDSDLRNSTELDPVIQSTLAVKKGYFEEDEFDTGRRNLLNYGHCFGHALESATDFAISHGQAVLVGMGIANRVSVERGMMNSTTFDHFEEIFRRFYPDYNWATLSVDSLIDYMKKDKKRVTKDLTMIIGSEVGDFIKADDLKPDEVEAAFLQFKSVNPVQSHLVV